MKRFSLILPLIILLTSCGKTTKEDEKTLNPKKGIKTETKFEYTYEEKFGEFEEILSMKKIYVYDPNGNLVEESKYDSEGLVDSKTIYKYDSNGNMVEWSMYDSNGKLDIKSISKYNDKNRLVEEIRYEYGLKFGELQEKPNRKTTYEYVEY